ncbi:hypothetical protein MK489_10100 [Myxococcota bacterium]|nr:hypothetical protein [Myxococcota bacterium]
MSQTSRQTDAIHWLTFGLCALLSACAFGRGSHDVDRTPITNAGAGASIVYPGRAAPSFSTGGRYGPPGGVIGGPSQPQEASGGGPNATPRSQSSGGPPIQPQPSATPEVSFLGGAQEDVVQHREYNEQPIWFKYAALPFAMAVAPFKAAADAALGEPEPGPALPNVTDRSQLPAPTGATPPNADTHPSTPGRSPAPQAHAGPPSPHDEPALDYESIRLRKLERELAQKQIPTNAPSNAPRRGRAPTLAQELAELERAQVAPRQASVPLEPMTPPGPRTNSSADGVVDRNQDGQIDQWLFRERGMLVREILDDDFDGQGERTLHYDPETHQIARVEEDYDHDTRIDAWTDYRDGRVIRRRSDADHDGTVDAWTYYVNGTVSRHERDTTGDGFRDRIGYYRDGVLDREEQDHDGDGHPEVTVRFDANENVRAREEDLDADGRIDLITHYQDGRLVRRELFESQTQQPRPGQVSAP